MLAPILVFTADEIWENLGNTPESLSSIHVELFPKAVGGDQSSLLANWERLFEIRDQVLRVLEESRIAKHIGSSLEAKVKVFAGGKTLDLLKNYSDDLRYLFIVSAVELVDSEKETVSITVEPAPGSKCERCWNYSTHVGESERFPTVCERCVAALEEIEREDAAANTT
jgi:isoleucyl-tRNA synthetase